MDSNSSGNTAASFSTEERWQEKRRSVMEKVAEGKRGVTLDQAEISREIGELRLDIEKLESSSHEMTGTLKEMQTIMAQKKNQCQRDFKLSDDLKKKLLRIQTAEQSLLNELDFFESEKLRLEEELKQVNQGLEANIYSLDSSVKDIDFMMGETSTLIEKMNVLEKEIPVKNTDIENLDDIVSGTIRALEGLYDRMRIIETRVKKTYYTNKKN